MRFSLFCKMLIFLSICGMMEYLVLKDQSDGLPVQRGSWEEDNETRAELYDRAKAMLLSFEKRRSKLSRTVSFYNNASIINI